MNQVTSAIREDRAMRWFLTAYIVLGVVILTLGAGRVYLAYHPEVCSQLSGKWANVCYGR